MAGFDFDFTYSPEHESYVEACISAAKRRARMLHCHWRVHRLGIVNGRRCVVDGQTRNLDLLGRALEHDLPTVCEGVPGGLAAKRARGIGTGFADLFLVGRHVDLGDTVQELRPKKDTTFYYPVYEFTDTTSALQLRARLRITEDVVTDYALGRYESVIVLEELHTALEQVLRALLPGLARDARWPTLIRAAEDHGLLEKDAYPLLDHEHSDQELLAEMTKRRNAAKHRDGDPNDSWLSEHWQCIAIVLERLVAKFSCAS